jgi:lysophospholipase L1-like esterase
MNRLLCIAGINYALIVGAFGQQTTPQTIIWPITPPPPGGNTAVEPMPALGWFMHFQFNMDSARKMAKVDLIFDGDSITDFWQGKGRAIWNQHYAKLNAWDFGISGDKTENVLWRLQNGQVDNLHPKLICLMIGTNNWAVNTPEQIADGVKADVEEYQKRCPDAVILLQAIFPRGPGPKDPARLKVKAVNDIISQLGDGKKVIYIDFSDKFLQPDGTLSPDIMPDFLHPTEAGYKIWADAIQPTIDQFFPPDSQ